MPAEKAQLQSGEGKLNAAPCMCLGTEHSRSCRRNLTGPRPGLGSLQERWGGMEMCLCKVCPWLQGWKVCKRAQQVFLSSFSPFLPFPKRVEEEFPGVTLNEHTSKAHTSLRTKDIPARLTAGIWCSRAQHRLPYPLTTLLILHAKAPHRLRDADLQLRGCDGRC